MQNYAILTRISEQPDLRKGILKQGFKFFLNFASDDPFKNKVIYWHQWFYEEP